jgi:cytochrome c-type biogenesis protein CcmH
MVWLVIILLAAATGLALWRWLRGDLGAMQFLGAALLLALAGYAWQGRPNLAGSPKAPPERGQVEESEFAKTREDMLGRFDQASQWLTISESYARRGDTQSAAQVIRSGLREAPQDPDLWVGLGNALVVHADGMMSPAAQLAFQRAAQLAPDHPGPRFFYGLSLAQGGQYDEAERIWRQLLAEAPADAEYRQTIEERLGSLERARAMGQLPGSPPPQSPPAPVATPLSPAG